MAVIINEFEVVVDSPEEQPAQAAAPAEQGPGAGPALTPQDIRDVLRHQMERRARLRAH
jgi:hypothetical protein